MPSKRKTDPRPLREQVEEYIYEGIAEFEAISGVKVSRIDVIHHKGIGFGAKDSIEINLITE